MAGGKAGGTGKKDELVQKVPAKKTKDEDKKKSTSSDWDELYDDGDIASPKRDRYGSDDEPY